MNSKNRSATFLLMKIFLLIFVPFILCLFDLNILMILTVEVFVVLCFVCLKDINSNIFFFCFLLSFFVFLMSGDIVSELFGEYYYIRFGKDAVNHCWITLLICLGFLYLGYKCKRNKDVSVQIVTEKNLKIKYSAKVIYYITYFVLIFNTIDKIIFVARNGYVAYYSSYNPWLPSIIAELGDFSPIALCVFLATFPTKKECKMPLISFCIYAVMTILIGSRSGLIYNIVFILGYMLFRNRHDKDSNIWISKHMVVFLCCLIPFLLVFLFVYGYIRLGQNVVYESFFGSIVDFFVNIGSSSTVIKYGYLYDDAIENFKFYSLGDTLNYFRYGRLFNLFSLDNIPSTHSAEFALEGHSFDAFISYQFMQAQYLKGEGAGSSFVATLFADFGYLGVAIGSFIYGVVFKSLSNLRENKWLSNAIKLYFFFSLIAAPRSSYDGFIAGIVNINFWLLIGTIYFVSQNLRIKRHER